MNQIDKEAQLNYEIGYNQALAEVEKMIDEYCSNKYGRTDMKIFDLEVRKELKQDLQKLKEKEK